LNPIEDIPVLFEDEALLVIDKPAGVLSLPDGYDRSLPHLATILEPEHGRLWLVHRLDRDTSGVLVLARSAAAHHNLNDQFRERRVEKVYRALVAPAPDWKSRSADFPLRKDGDRQHRTVVDPERGKPAITDFKVIERYGQAALLEARPHTGYTHQIRAHLRALGCPILADTLYRLPESQDFYPPPIDRMGLHAYKITFTHPVSGETMVFKAPPPNDFETAITRLRIQPVYNTGPGAM
jgi:tRNA pseudouridine32 synthase/23S rRNA pseudouridine746 synthase